ncbi:MAG: peptide chain release factor 2 [Bacilli bacterium]|jgi:peptide chain release factor 2|nr:peptide chain release factor 2 [Bacilli bacterium]MDY0064564.1 peptide chain release factor 2 [Bacilli bacterium]
MENYEINKAIENYTTRLEELEVALDIKQLKIDLQINEEKMNQPSFWNNPQESAVVLKQVKAQKEQIGTFSHLKTLLDDLQFYFTIHKSEEEDVLNDIIEIVKQIDIELNEFELKMLLSKEYDDCDAIFEMHPGAGGTESQDWCEMLFRMYKRYAERKGYQIEVLDYQDGEEAGIKSVSFIIRGEKAYGYLKSEQGVHRLVRISPFDSNARRHTSFCAVTIFPSVEQDVNIEIKPEDIRVDTYRSSGAGGQYVNKTDSAVRITHLKTGIVVTCQNERSQIQNREKALQILKSKLYQLELEENSKKLKEVSGEVAENTFGSQIRSYVFHPYSMIKDLRTDYEEFNTTSVMDGDLDGFINAYLKSSYNRR